MFYHQTGWDNLISYCISSNVSGTVAGSFLCMHSAPVKHRSYGNRDPGNVHILVVNGFSVTFTRKRLGASNVNLFFNVADFGVNHTIEIHNT